MTVSTRLLLAASLCLAPLSWAAAQDQPPDSQHQRDHQDQHQQQDHKPAQQQQHAPPQQQQHTQQAPQGNTAPQGQHGGGPAGGGSSGRQGGGEHQFQRPAQNNPAPQPQQQQQQFQRPPAQTNAAPPSPPTGATAAPTPPSTQGQFQRGQRPPQNPPQNNVAAPATAAPQVQAQPQQQQQQFQQRGGQRGGGAPVGSAAPQAQSQPQQQQQTTTNRGNFQGNNRGANTASFTQHHAGFAPTQFGHGHFYGRDYAHFTVHDRDLWYRGAWRHEFHDGRFGWWYAVDGIWYFYDQPVYPYPTYIPDVVYIPEQDDAPPSDYVDAPYEAAPAPPQFGQPPAYYYYFCPDSQTYYPYVSSCASTWQPVPAAPPQ